MRIISHEKFLRRNRGAFLLRDRKGKRLPGLKPLCVQAAYIIGLIYRSRQVRRLSSLLNYLRVGCEIVIVIIILIARCTFSS